MSRQRILGPCDGLGVARHQVRKTPSQSTSLADPRHLPRLLAGDGYTQQHRLQPAAPGSISYRTPPRQPPKVVKIPP
jgi:hypothetical protein